MNRVRYSTFIKIRYFLIFICSLVSLSVTACRVTDQEEAIPEGMEEIVEYLMAQPGGGNADDPVDLILDINLPKYGIYAELEDDQSEYIQYSGLNNLLEALAYSKKYVNLDLSDCIMSAPDLLLRGSRSSETGMSYIVSLVLPDEAISIHMSVNFMTDGQPIYANQKFINEEDTEIGASSRSVPPRQNFINMKTVSGKNIETIGKRVLESSYQLVNVNFPKTITIDAEAFSNCYSLQKVSFPLVTSIGASAFKDCNLANIDLSSIQQIDNYAFDNNRSSDLSIIMGSVAPNLNTNIFHRLYIVATNKNIIVQVPAGAIGYGDFTGDPPQVILSGSDQIPCWGNGLRGFGWDGDAFTYFNPDYKLHEFISLNIQMIPEQSLR